MILRIEAFTNENGNNVIPKKYTCNGEEVSPGVQWSEAPEKTKSFVLLMEGIDEHDRSNPLLLWLLYNIPGDLREIITNEIPVGAHVAINDLGKQGYTGPCPEPGKTHYQYQITLHALDAKLFLPNTAPAHGKEIKRAMKDHIIATAYALATYENHKTS
jgi:hypothetical protein